MGGVKKIQTYTSTSPVTKKEDIIINNPVNREFKTDSTGNTNMWVFDPWSGDFIEKRKIKNN